MLQKVIIASFDFVNVWMVCSQFDYSHFSSLRNYLPFAMSDVMDGKQQRKETNDKNNDYSYELFYYKFRTGNCCLLLQLQLRWPITLIRPYCRVSVAAPKDHFGSQSTTRQESESDTADAAIYFSSQTGAWCTGVILNVRWWRCWRLTDSTCKPFDLLCFATF